MASDGRAVGHRFAAHDESVKVRGGHCLKFCAQVDRPRVLCSLCSDLALAVVATGMSSSSRAGTRRCQLRPPLVQVWRSCVLLPQHAARDACEARSPTTYTMVRMVDAKRPPLTRAREVLCAKSYLIRKYISKIRPVTSGKVPLLPFWRGGLVGKECMLGVVGAEHNISVLGVRLCSQTAFANRSCSRGFACVCKARLPPPRADPFARRGGGTSP